MTPWTEAHQATLSSTIFWSLLKFMSIELVMLSNHLILCRLLLLLPSIFPSIFPMTWLFVSGGQNIGASASASVLPTESLCCPSETLWINYTSILKKELNIFLSWIVKSNFLKLKLVTVLANMSSPLFLRHPLGPAGPQSLWDHTPWRAPLKRTSLGTVPFPKSLPPPTFSCT